MCVMTQQCHRSFLYNLGCPCQTSTDPHGMHADKSTISVVHVSYITYCASLIQRVLLLTRTDTNTHFSRCFVAAAFLFPPASSSSGSSSSSSAPSSASDGAPPSSKAGAASPRASCRYNPAVSFLIMNQCS